MSPCDMFDDGLDELALGLLDGPDEEALLAHASSCPRCQGRLDEMAALADRLLLVAPEVEPPAGFEAGALARMGGTTAVPARHVWWWVVSAVAAVLLALVVGVVVGRAGDGQGDSVARSGTIVATSGASVGTVELRSSPSPHVLVHVAQPRPGAGVRTCELELADGRRVAVGTWNYDEIESGIWAVGIDKPLLDAVAMRVIDEDGSVLATAALT
jgi:anti-sigma factor RsiW